jgi:hypothetical protein
MRSIRAARVAASIGAALHSFGISDAEIVAAVYEALATRHPQSRKRGRPGTPAEVVLRLLVLKSNTCATGVIIETADVGENRYSANRKEVPVAEDVKRQVAVAILPLPATTCSLTSNDESPPMTLNGAVAMGT